MGELSVTAGEGENTILPMLIAEGIDSAGENAGSASEKDGVLTIKTEADGSACTVTADSSPGIYLHSGRRVTSWRCFSAMFRPIPRR